MKVAALDLGTNTFLCLIAEVVGEQVTKIYDDQVRVVRLGQEVQKTKRFHPEALMRAHQALTDFSQIIKEQKPEKVLAMATSASRDVENADELFKIGRDLGIPIQIIPGSREAEITFQGAVSSFNDQNKRLIVDVGGGSTELIVGQGKKMRAGKSVNLGCVRLTEKFGLQTPLAKRKLTELILEVRAGLDPVIEELLSDFNGVDEILAVAGTPTEIARIELGAFIAEKIDGFILTEKKLRDWLEIFQNHSAAELTAKYSVNPGRADVILSGTVLLLETLRACRKTEMKVSTRGVRFGVALEMVGK